MQAKYVAFIWLGAPAATLGAERASRTPPERLASNQRRFSPEIRTSPLLSDWRTSDLTWTPLRMQPSAEVPCRARSDRRGNRSSNASPHHKTGDSPDPEQHVRDR